MTRVAVIAAIASLLALGATVAGAVPQTTTTSTTTFRDRAEDAAMPDATTTTVTTDGRQLALQVAIPTHLRVTPDMRLRLWLDTDDDRATGLSVEGLEGVDSSLLVDPPRFGLAGVVLHRCGGTTCSPVEARAELRYARGATFLVDAQMLGRERIERFAFRLEVLSGIGYDSTTRRYDLTNATVDRAPDEGWWRYDARAVPYRHALAAPATPRAGQRFVLRMRADGSHARPGSAQVGCKLVLGPRRAVRMSGSRLTRDAAVCVFDVLPGTRGRPFRATIRVTAGASHVESSLFGRIG